MFGLLLAGSFVGFVGSVVARRRLFLRQFASLLTNPQLRQGSPILALFKSSESLRGEFQGRAVGVVLKYRIDDRLGHLIVAMQTRAPDQLAPLDTLADEGLTVVVDEGWVKATWMPVRFFVFPGRFDEGKWRGVLRRLHSLAGSLEARTWEVVPPCRLPASM